MLLTEPDFVWSVKIPDSGLYGGQPRIDWLACDYLGRFWMIEAKQIVPTRRSINLDSDVSAGQRRALTSVVSGNGIALLVVGQADRLYIYSWRALWSQYQASRNPLVKLEGLGLLHVFQWFGPKKWAPERLYDKVMGPMGERAALGPLPLSLPDDPSIPLTPPPPGMPSSDPELSPSILRPEDFTRISERTRRLGQLFSERTSKTSSSESSPTGGDPS
jgi:hypothetical protein